MIKEAKKVWGAYQAAKNGHSLAIMQGHTNCNRACGYCNVHNQQNLGRFSTVDESCQQVSWAKRQGFGVFQLVGGEYLGGAQFDGGVRLGRYQMCMNGANLMYEDFSGRVARFTTDEGITYIEHALKVSKYASGLGMITNLITNGDFLDNTYYLSRLKKAGLDILTFSMHSPTEAGIRSIVGKARAAANEGIIPTASMVFTADRADVISKAAKTCAANGILFSMSLVQEIGQGFSTVPVKSNIPTKEQIRKVCEELKPLKKAGFVINNRDYLAKIADSPDKLWKCSSEKDQFVHIRAVGEKGELGVCSEIRIGLNTSVDLKSEEWRKIKRKAVKECLGCLYNCFYKSQNQDLAGDFRTLVPMALTKFGHAGLARMLGRRAVGDLSEVIPVPESEIEKSQAWLKEYDKLHSRIKRRGRDLLDTVMSPVAIVVVLANYAAASFIVSRRGINQDEVDRAFLMSIAYPGVGLFGLEGNERENQNASYEG